ncbi:hypothetical protein B0T09DRAFT_164173 [Sordaria sp. MPI-SDFR-AT-0083]|nr:hypothetical protein B0T09DRAFT_164173 [Sordaria sp. MPI-SDFR-AT-0083]
MAAPKEGFTTAGKDAPRRLHVHDEIGSCCAALDPSGQAGVQEPCTHVSRYCISGSHQVPSPVFTKSVAMFIGHPGPKLSTQPPHFPSTLSPSHSFYFFNPPNTPHLCRHSQWGPLLSSFQLTGSTLERKLQLAPSRFWIGGHEDTIDGHLRSSVSYRAFNGPVIGGWKQWAQCAAVTVAFLRPEYLPIRIIQDVGTRSAWKRPVQRRLARLKRQRLCGVRSKKLNPGPPILSCDITSP